MHTRIYTHAHKQARLHARDCGTLWISLCSRAFDYSFQKSQSRRKNILHLFCGRTRYFWVQNAWLRYIPNTFIFSQKKEGCAWYALFTASENRVKTPNSQDDMSHNAPHLHFRGEKSEKHRGFLRAWCDFCITASRTQMCIRKRDGWKAGHVFLILRAAFIFKEFASRLSQLFPAKPLCFAYKGNYYEIVFFSAGAIPRERRCTRLLSAWNAAFRRSCVVFGLNNYMLAENAIFQTYK